MDTNSWQYLLDKYMSNTISKVELDELLKMADKYKNMDEFDSALKIHWENAKEKSGVERTDWGGKFEAMMEEARNVAPIVQIRQTKKFIYRFTAAASILLLLSAGWYFLFFSKLPQKIAKNETNSLQHDIAPPTGTKTTLTLANGSEIVLDSVQNGTLAKQGNTNIKKLNSKELAYNEMNEKPTLLLYNTLSTARGGQTMVILADGSKVWLNALSSLKFPTTFIGKERNVELTGEAYFEVTKNANMPFYVKVNRMKVEDLGTHFNIKAYTDENETETTLLEGSVKVNKGNQNLVIVPGEQAAVSNSSDKITLKKDVDVEETIGWKNGNFTFQRADIKSIMRQLGKWYDITVSYSREPANVEYEGIISRNVNISEILQMLEKTGPVRFEIDGRKIIVK